MLEAMVRHGRGLLKARGNLEAAAAASINGMLTKINEDSSSAHYQLRRVGVRFWSIRDARRHWYWRLRHHRYAIAIAAIRGPIASFRAFWPVAWR